ncbi:VAPA protein, partial [Polypterus senegalus]
MMSSVTLHGLSEGSAIIKSFSVFCHDAWPEDIDSYGKCEIDTLVKWYRERLSNNGCDVTAMQKEWLTLKILVKGQFMNKTYGDLWTVMLSKEPFCTDFKNLLHLVEIMLVLLISAAQCERGFSAQNRIKSKARNSLSVETLEDLWKDAKSDDLMDSKLRCIFELPSENEKVNDIEPSKATPVLNSSKQDGPSMPKPTSMSLDDTEMRKLMEECKRLQSEVVKLSDENRQLKDEGLRMRKVTRQDNMVPNTGGLMGRDNSSNSLPSLLVVIAAIFIGFFLGKFIL